ncbi:MAG TPA: hypothetical protein VNC82_22655 [Candidatus Limnocylindria bacterium]|nr:hypothetical protein [Candidatus Limnocylindria bacterium]
MEHLRDLRQEREHGLHLASARILHPLPEDGDALRADEIVDAGAPDRDKAHGQHRQENEEPPPPP